MAPSASNKQPWRVIREGSTPIFHFYLAENKLYNSLMKGIKIQNVDMGIALCHFAEVVQALGKKGAISRYDSAPVFEGLSYCATWQ